LTPRCAAISSTESHRSCMNFVLAVRPWIIPKPPVKAFRILRDVSDKARQNWLESTQRNVELKRQGSSASRCSPCRNTCSASSPPSCWRSRFKIAQSGKSGACRRVFYAVGRQGNLTPRLVACHERSLGWSLSVRISSPKCLRFPGAGLGCLSCHRQASMASGCGKLSIALNCCRSGDQRRSALRPPCPLDLSTGWSDY